MGILGTGAAVRVAEDILNAFDQLNGPQPGYRPAHAKGILLTGRFTPSTAGPALSRAAHLERASTPVTVRFSDFAGIPVIPDNHPQAAPRGIAIRFHLAEHTHTDIIAHSVDGFPVRTAEEFAEFLRAIGQSGPGAPKPSPVEMFLGTHPAALAFVSTPKPLPASFSSESYYAVSAYRFVSNDGSKRFGRYRIVPKHAVSYLEAAAAANVGPDFLFEEIRDRLASGPVGMRIEVQLAAAHDVVDDATVHWPVDREVVPFGDLELTGVLPNNDAEQKRIIFDPIPRLDGIEPSEDPLLEVRATAYLISGRRRRTEATA